MDESANTPDAPDTTTPAWVARSDDSSHEPDLEDDGPEPALDAAIGAQVTALLAAAPDPGPMPERVSDRIAAALEHEARLRIDRGPLVGDEGSRAGAYDGGLGGTVTPLAAARRPRPIYAVAAVAAAAAVVVLGASALHLGQRANGAAVIGDTVSSTTPSRGPATRSTGSTMHIQLSPTAYDAATLSQGARELLDHPGAPLTGLAAEAPGLGPIATPIGLHSCLEALGSPVADSVSADLATYAGQPAVVVVVTRGGSSTAWAVARSCSTGAPGVLQGATPVP